MSTEPVQLQAKAGQAQAYDRNALERYRRKLAIDRDDLDLCLQEQPELFYQVSEGQVLANASRDATKLMLEEAEAAEDDRLRTQAAKHAEKITEPEIKRAIKQAPEVKRLGQEYLEFKTLAARWGVLKESYEQRSYMLKELVSTHLSRISARGSMGGARDEIIARSRSLMEGEERRRLRLEGDNDGTD
jgi:hypothetical protein